MGDQSLSYVARTDNARFFDQLGSPGGAAKTGPLPYDRDYVASYVVTGR